MGKLVKSMTWYLLKSGMSPRINEKKREPRSKLNLSENVSLKLFEMTSVFSRLEFYKIGNAKT